MSYIFGKENFLALYRTLSDTERRRIWIIVSTSDNSSIYLEDYSDWLTMNDYCRNSNVTIDMISLQYRSHRVDFPTKDCDGVYVAKTAKGQIGAVTKHCISIGVLKGNKIYKTLFTTPELIEDFKLEDNIEDCLQEALVIYERKT